MTSKARWFEVRERVFKDQHGQCARCTRTFASHEDMHAHHAVYSRQKGLEKWLDSEQNIILLCSHCHLDDHGLLTSWFRRCTFWKMKVEQGYQMDEWHNEIPMLIKDVFTWDGE